MMLKTCTFFCILLALMLSAVAMAPAGQDWPQWRGPDRTGCVPAGEAVPKTLPADPKVLWRQEAGYSLASPVVSNGRVFTLDDEEGKEVVCAADANTGKPLWHTELDEETHDTQSDAGPRTTPLADGDRVYAQSCRGHLVCLDSADGKLKWETRFTKDFGAIFIGEKGPAMAASRHGYTASPLIDGEHLIAEAGGKGAGIVCFDKKTGAVVWKTQDDMAGYAAPIIATAAGVRQIIAFTAIAVVGINPADGKLLWRVPIKTRLGRHAATPVVVKDMVLVSSHQAGLLGISLKKKGADIDASITWTNKDLAINYASPVVVGKCLYGVGPKKNLICVDTGSGKLAWAKENFFSSNGGKAYAGMIVMGDRILILSDDGQLVLIAANPKEYQEISRAQGCGSNWCNPAYVDGKLYLRDAHEVRCIELLR